MFEELLMLGCLLLALYGLACLITTAALWFTAPTKGRPYKMLILLKKDEHIRSAIMAVQERLSNSGLNRSTRLIAVNCGLKEEQAKKAAEYCKIAGIQFCEPGEILNLLEIPSFQTPENKV